MNARIYGLLFLGLAVVGGGLAIDRYYSDRLEHALDGTENVAGLLPSQVKYIVPESRELMYGEELLEALRGGGYVLFVRHFQTDHTKWHEDPIKGRHHLMKREDFLTCENQRMLTDVGRMRATIVGRIMKTQKIPVGRILSSPYCRASQGVELMFGREPDESPYGLIYRGGEYTREMMSDFLRPFLGEKPEAGTNTVIMGHRTQMDDVGAIAEGQMNVFEPLGESKFKLVGQIHDYEWMESLRTPKLFGLTTITKLPEGYAEQTLQELGL